jgi:type I restriction enzyme S subunit
VVRKRDGGSLFPVYGGGGATFSVDKFNRENCFIVSRFGMSAECVRYVTGRFFLNDSGLTVHTKSDEVLQEFLDRYLLANQAAIYALSRGTAQRNLDVALFRALRVSYPKSLEEQRRIVAVLDEAFAAIATATANAEKNLASARSLPSAALAHFDLAAGAKPRRLGDIVDRLTNGYVGPIANVYVDKGVPYLLARHVRDDVLEFDGRTFITEAFNQASKKSILLAGDVLLVQSGHIGHSAVVPPEHAGHNCHAMIVITPKQELLGEYLSAYFNSLQGRQATARIRSGSTVPHLTCKEVRELLIPVPDRSAQKALVHKYKTILKESATLTDLYQRKLAGLEAFRRILLHRAFSGDLTEREPLAA